MTKPSEKDVERAHELCQAILPGSWPEDRVIQMIATRFAAVREEGRVAGLEQAAKLCDTSDRAGMRELAIVLREVLTPPDAGKTSEGVAPSPGGRASRPDLLPPGGGSKDPGTTPWCTCFASDMRGREPCPVHGKTSDAKCTCPTWDAWEASVPRVHNLRCPVHGKPATCTCRYPHTGGTVVVSDPKCQVHGKPATCARCGGTGVIPFRASGSEWKRCPACAAADKKASP
jgi:hypothetical protein